MNYLFNGGETFSLSAIHAIDTQAKYQLLPQPRGDFGMKGESTAESYYVETEVTGLTAGETYTLNLEFVDIVSNFFYVFINENPNDNSNPIVYGGWGEGKRSFTFVSPSDTVYVAFGDAEGGAGTYFIVDNVSLLNGSQEMITNGTFETDTSGWYVQTGTDGVIEHYEYNPVEDNPYLKDVVIPPYDSGNPAHLLCNESNGNFTEANLNDSTYTNYYIEPGNYYVVDLWLVNNRHGTAENPITISLYNGDDEHPGVLGLDNIAQLPRIKFTICSYINISRAGGTYNSGFEFLRTTDVIVDRMYTTADTQPIRIDTGTRRITVQKSRYEVSLGGDDAACVITAWDADYEEADGTQHFSAHDIHFISNEVIDANDSFMPAVYAIEMGSTFQYGNVAGMVIYDNDMYLLTTADRENGTDSKCGSPDPRPDAEHDNPEDNPTKTCIIARNRYWDYNGTGGDEGTQSLIASMFSNNYDIYENILFNCTVAHSGGANSEATGMYTGYEDSLFHDNILYQCGGDTAWGDRADSPIRMSNGRNNQLYNNYIIEPNLSLVGRFYDMSGGSKFENNYIVDPYNGTFEFYDSPVFPNDQEFIDSLATNTEKERTGFTDYIFTADKYSPSPRQIVLTAILDPDGPITSPEVRNESLPAEVR